MKMGVVEMGVVEMQQLTLCSCIAVKILDMYYKATFLSSNVGEKYI